MKTISSTIHHNGRSTYIVLFAVLALVGMIAIPDMAMAQGLQKIDDSVQKILDTLRMVSIGVVTIAVIWSGYKLAFANARMMDVMPVLGGGLLVGAAAEIARFLVQ